MSNNGIIYQLCPDVLVSQADLTDKLSAPVAMTQLPSISSFGPGGRKSVHASNNARLDSSPIITLGSGIRKIGITFALYYDAGQLNTVFPFFACGSIAALDRIKWIASGHGDIFTISRTHETLTIKSEIVNEAGSDILALTHTPVTLIPGQHYRFEILLDYTDTIAKSKVWLDGVMICDATFARDRAEPVAGGSTSDFEYVALTGGSGGADPYWANHFADVVIYDPDHFGDGTSPIGPLSVHYTPAGPDFGLPVDDATSVLIPGAPGLTYDVDAMSDDVTYASYAIARTAPQISGLPHQYRLTTSTSLGKTETFSSPVMQRDAPENIEYHLNLNYTASELSAMSIEMEML